MSFSLHFSHSDCENSNSPSDEFHDVFSGNTVKEEVKSVRLFFLSECAHTGKEMFANDNSRDSVNCGVYIFMC